MCTGHPSDEQPNEEQMGLSLNRSGGLAAACFALLIAPGAMAQELQTRQIDLPKLNPAPAGDRFFGVPSPYAAGDVGFHAMAMLDYAREPFVLVREGDDGRVDVGDVVSDQLLVHVGLNLSLASRIAFNVNMPFAVLSQGDAPVGTALRFDEPEGAALGDFRAGLRINLIGRYHDAFQLSAGGYFWAPSGSKESYVSDGAIRGQPHLLLGGRADRFVWSVTTGPTLRNTTTVGRLVLQHQMNWGAGVGVLLLEDRSFQLHVESAGGVDVSTPDAGSTNAEVMGGLKWRLPGAEMLEIGLGGGPGLATGVGTPVFRGVFQLAYTPVIPEPKADSDGDGIFDDVDACAQVRGVASPDPTKHGCPPDVDRDKDSILDKDDACPTVSGLPNADPAKHGCPLEAPPAPRDSDGDRITDEVDACVEVPGVASDDPKKHGCPLPRDKDNDGVVDDEDACVDIPGVKTSDPKTHGCPPDSDGDGFRDDMDGCPKEKGVDDPDPSKRGCPKLVRFTDKEIIILEQVQFDTGKATIRRVSDALLDSVAQVLKEHPEVLVLEVQGHTDNRGGKPLNQKLSDDRARSVRDALIARGIEAGRLAAKGYGMDRPIADNTSEPGRQQNRRVQFIVIDKKPVAAPTTTPPPAARP